MTEYIYTFTFTFRAVLKVKHRTPVYSRALHGLKWVVLYCIVIALYLYILYSISRWTPM